MSRADWSREVIKEIAQNMRAQDNAESEIAIGDTVRVVSANDVLTKTAMRDHDDEWGLVIGDIGTVSSMLLEDDGGVSIKVEPIRCMDRRTSWHVALSDLEKVQP